MSADPPGPGSGPADTPAPAPGASRGADLVRQTLARAKADARTRSSTKARATRSEGRARAAAAEPVRESADPVAFGAAVQDLLAERGWSADAAAAGVLANWSKLVGPEIASRCSPVRLRGGELQIEAESTAWATQLRLLSRQLLATLQAELGPGVVTRLSVRGPSAPDWRHGRLRVRGPGPRDTYG